MTVRYMQKGTTKFYFLPTIALASTTKVPTAAECLAGSKITKDLADINGFNFENDPIETPDMESTFTASIPGEDKADTSSLGYYERKLLVNNPTKTVLAKGTIGFVVIFPYGIAGANPAINDECDIWPVQIASNVRGYSAGNEAGKYTVTFTMSDTPALDKKILS